MEGVVDPSTAVGAGHKSLREKIADLKAELRQVKSSRAELTKQIRNVSKQRTRLKRKAAGLSANDLIELLKQKEEKAEDAAAPSMGASSKRQRFVSSH